MGRTFFGGERNGTRYHRNPSSSIHISRVGQNRIYTPYMTVYLVISLPKIPYVNRIYMVLANPTHKCFSLPA